MQKAPDFSHAFLLENLRYNPATGKWRRLRRFPGPAGCFHISGYRWIRLKGTRYFEHSLAWFYMTGRWPKNMVDHKDGKKANNRWKNLRAATRSQNGANRRINTKRKNSYKGIQPDRHKFRARIVVRGKHINLGTFADAKSAHRAYCVAAKKHFGAFARAR